MNLNQIDFEAIDNDIHDHLYKIDHEHGRQVIHD